MGLEPAQRVEYQVCPVDSPVNCNRVGGTVKRICFIILLTLGMCAIAQVVPAKKAYVTDTFRISLRRGPSVENKILKFLPSGLRVDIKESSDGWDRVQVQEGENETLEGWVLSRYLISRLPWETQAESLLQENTTLKGEHAGILEELRQRLQESQIRIKELTADSEGVSETTQSLVAENRSLKSSLKIKLFVMGASVLLLGMLIGSMAGRQRRKQTHY